MNYEVEEDRIVNHLTTMFGAYALEKGVGAGKIDISPLPQVEEDFDQSFGKRKLYVCFVGEEADNNQKSLSAVSQEANAMFSVLVKAKNLRFDGVTPGVYGIVELLKKYLLGFETADGQPLVYVDTKFESRNNGVFEYSVNFASKIFVTQDLPFTEPTLGANLTKVNYNG